MSSETEAGGGGETEAGGGGVSVAAEGVSVDVSLDAAAGGGATVAVIVIGGAAAGLLTGGAGVGDDTVLWLACRRVAGDCASGRV